MEGSVYLPFFPASDLMLVPPITQTHLEARGQGRVMTRSTEVSLLHRAGQEEWRMQLEGQVGKKASTPMWVTELCSSIPSQRTLSG